MKNQETCTHTRHIFGRWEKSLYYSDSEGRFVYGEEEWVDAYELDTVVDINLNQYKCTQCGKIFNY